MSRGSDVGKKDWILFSFAITCRYLSSGTPFLPSSFLAERLGAPCPCWTCPLRMNCMYVVPSWNIGTRPLGNTNGTRGQTETITWTCHFCQSSASWKLRGVIRCGHGRRASSLCFRNAPAKSYETWQPRQQHGHWTTLQGSARTQSCRTTKLAEENGF